MTDWQPPTPWQYPTLLEQPEELLTELGGYWYSSFPDQNFAERLAYAPAVPALEDHETYVRVLDSLSRIRQPSQRWRSWLQILLLESDRNASDVSIPKYGTEISYGGGAKYGTPIAGQYHVFPAPDHVLETLLLSDRITTPNVCLISGVDYYIEEGALVFRLNPFENSDLPIEETIDESGIAQRTLKLWGFQNRLDTEEIYEQFGYSLGWHHKDSPTYQRGVNAVLDAITQGTCRDHLSWLLSALTDIPLAETDGEVVTHIEADGRFLWIFTDLQAYRHHLLATPSVSVGDVVNQGESLTGGLVISPLQRGVVPDHLSGLSLDGDYLADGFYGPLYFPDGDMPLVVETDEEGYTKVSCEIWVFPGDVELFWDLCHSRGLERGKTLAQLLDLREVPNGEPTAASLPPTLNPLQFLIENVLRFHGTVVQVRDEQQGPDALGLASTPWLTQILPPHTSFLLVISQSETSTPIRVTGAPSADWPGYTESMTISLLDTGSLTVDPTTLLAEDTMRFRTLFARCGD